MRGNGRIENSGVANLGVIVSVFMLMDEFCNRAVSYSGVLCCGMWTVDGENAYILL